MAGTVRSHSDSDDDNVEEVSSDESVAKRAAEQAVQTMAPVLEKIMRRLGRIESSAARQQAAAATPRLDRIKRLEVLGEAAHPGTSLPTPAAPADAASADGSERSGGSAVNTDSETLSTQPASGSQQQPKQSKQSGSAAPERVDDEILIRSGRGLSRSLGRQAARMEDDEDSWEESAPLQSSNVLDLDRSPIGYYQRVLAFAPEEDRCCFMKPRLLKLVDGIRTTDIPDDCRDSRVPIKSAMLKRAHDAAFSAGLFVERYGWAIASAMARGMDVKKLASFLLSDLVSPVVGMLLDVCHLIGLYTDDQPGSHELASFGLALTQLVLCLLRRHNSMYCLV